MIAVPSSRAAILSGIDYVRRWGVVEHWAGNEASGARLASISSANDMTAVNAPTSAAGLVYPTARQYTAASSQYHSLADNAAMSGGAFDMWGTAWAYADTLAAEMAIMGKYLTTGGQREYLLEYVFTATNRFRLVASLTGGATTTLDANTFGAPSTATWTFLMWYLRYGVEIGLSVNGGPFDTTAYTTAIFDGTSPFAIGAIANPTLYWNGRIGPVTIGKSPPGGIAALATEIRDAMYRNGTGLQYPFRH